MIPVQFDYVRADSADAALAALGEHGDEAKLMAGGHSLLPMMKLRLAYPAVVVDIGRLSDLSYINDAGDHLAIGALTRHRDIEISDLVNEHAPLLAHATAHVGDPQVRHRGTIGDLDIGLIAAQALGVALGQVAFQAGVELDADVHDQAAAGAEARAT